MTLSRRSDNDLHVKIVVTVKQVPDPNSATLLEPDHTLARDREVVLDPGDECGIEEGLQLKEAHGGEVILVSMGPERAELLGVPQLTIAKKVEVDGSTVRIHRQTADGYQVVEASTPVLITVTAGIAEPRYASLKGIMAARSKEIKQVGLGELGVERGEPGETIEGLADAEARKAGAIVQDDGTAVDRILQVLAEAKVV